MCNSTDNTKQKLEVKPSGEKMNYITRLLIKNLDIKNKKKISAPTLL